MRYTHLSCFLLIYLLLAGCTSADEPAAEEAEAVVKTPVMVTTVSREPLKETVELNAVSSYQKKDVLKAATDGYIIKMFVKPGARVKAGSPLFTLKTKEAQVLGDLMTKDPALNFNGMITVRAPSSGVVLELNHQAGDYVNDGEQLGLISELSSFVFLVNVPFELNRYTTIGTAVSILLPDSTKIPGTITSKLASMSTASQTQQFVVTPETDAILPENLQAVVVLNKQEKPSTQVLSKEAVLTNETLDKYWVMKLINDTTAVKVPVKTGIITERQVEILSPTFAPTDRILISGNYGLPDTAFVKVQNRQPE
ncbi:efflux RND transporter periplasmic adaptor subunit [Pontibacter sp. MBLB2868]|uniref:efflux RND transporter periplasmic adaptor subunit n=1 Tax=Pontibacter sp. MBLB2868 TaxID=3451555 RepID=UPI003F74BD7F